MLSGFLDSIKSQFGGKSYWLAAMLPLVLFLAANILVLYGHFPDLATWLPKADGLDQKTLLYSTLTATLLALAYVLSIMSSVMLEALEGKIGPFRWTSSLLYGAQAHTLRTIDRDYQSARALQREIKDERTNWEDRLDRSLRVSETAPALPGSYPIIWHFTAVGRKMAYIRFSQRRGRCINPEDLRKAVNVLTEALIRNKAIRQSLLSNAVDDLRSAITYALDRYQFEIRRLVHLRQTNFPGVRPTAVNQPEGPSANSILLPTAMGNIGRAMSTYTLMRYQLDLDIFWTRLQNSLQKDAKDYYAVLQDSKVQVDCAVTLFWFSLAFTLFWPPALLWWLIDSTVREFLLVSVVGSVFTVVSYILACQGYRVFADVMRSSVDLFRFQILQALHLSLPYGSEEERDLWLRLGGATGFGNEENFQYKHSP
jgi:hypothetical protein